ncbi:ATP-dependent DNA helicase PIF1, partial [Paragonimus westermani]
FIFVIMLTIRCDIVIEEFGADKCTIKRRIVLKDSQLAAVRDDIRQILLRVTPLGSSKSSKMVIKSFGYPVIDLDMHKRFIGQGKASISLPVHSVRLMLSNCPPDKLRLFLATLRLKVNATQTTLFRKPIISDAPPTSLSLLEELSPLRLPPSCILSPSSRSSQQVLTGPLQVSTPVRQSKSSKPRYRSFSRALHQTSSAHCHADLQMKVIDLVNQGRNIFCTGGAGTGKSYLIRRVIGLLPPDRTAITASTGTAANLIGGITVHAFSGVGDLLSMEIGGSVEDNKAWLSALRTRLCGSPSIVAHWKKIRHLIIDEISMLSAEVFTRLEQLAQETRCPSDPDNIRVQNPFGGIQVVLFGDFFQLPPVKKNGQAQFAFESPCWKRCRLATVELQHSWRQSDDPDLSRLLTAAREGKCPEWMQQLLKSRCVPNREPPENESSIVPTRLCTHRSDADAWNLRMLNALQGTFKNQVMDRFSTTEIALVVQYLWIGI